MFAFGPAAAVEAVIRAQTPPPVVQQVDDEVVIRSATGKREAGVGILSGNVVVEYGLTRIYADEVRIYEAESRAEAVGAVRVVDPDGTVSASRLELSWVPGKKGATLGDVKGEVAGTRFEARTARIAEGEWTFEDVQGTTCRNEPPLYRVSAPRLTIQPGQRGTVTRPSFTLLGVKVITLPRYGFNLSRRVGGIGVPSVGFRRGEGLGVNWSPSLIVARQTVLAGGFSAFQSSYPSYGLGLYRSFLTDEESNAVIAPRDPLGTRFTYSYFDSIDAGRPDQELRFLATPRKTVGVESQFNRGSPREGDDRFSRLLDLSYETSGVVRGWGAFGQARAQSVRQNSDPFRERLYLWGAVAPPALSLRPDLTAYARLETNAFLGRNTAGWTRGSVGVAYTPRPWLTLGTAAVVGGDYGRFDFDVDRLQYGTGVHFRVDLNLGPTTIRYLTKRDLRRGWYDQQFYASQVIGCLEAFIVTSKVPRDYRFGFKIRVDQFVDLLQRRRFERRAPAESPP